MNGKGVVGRIMNIKGGAYIGDIMLAVSVVKSGRSRGHKA